jgi:hypothetical protein
VGRLLNSTKDIHFANRVRPGDPVRWVADIRKLRISSGTRVRPTLYDLEGRLRAR